MKLVATAALCLWLAAGCQASLGNSALSPDFLLIVVGVLSQFSTRRGGTVLGFAAGVLTGGISGANMAGYTLSRTIGGFLASWFHQSESEESVVMALVTTAMVSLVAGLIHTFVAPPTGSDFLRTLGATIGSAVVNGVLAMPFYLIVRPILRPRA